MEILKTSKLSVIINPCHAEYLFILCITLLSNFHPVYLQYSRWRFRDDNNVDPDQMASSEAS